jgi:hypothetical protein
MSFVMLVPPTKNSKGEHDIVARLQKDRQTFYIKAASAARALWRWTSPNLLWGLQYNPQVCSICCRVVCWNLIWSAASFLLSKKRLRIRRTTHHSWTGCLQHMADSTHLRIRYNLCFFPIHLCFHIPIQVLQSMLEHASVWSLWIAVSMPR